MTITTSPATRVISPRLVNSQEVSAPRVAPSAMNTSENPSTNRATPATTLPSWRPPWPAAGCRWSPAAGRDRRRSSAAPRAAADLRDHLSEQAGLEVGGAGSPVDRAVDPGADPPLLVDHQRRRREGRRLVAQLGGEGCRGVEQRRVGGLELALVGLGRGALVADVDTDEAHALAGQLPRGLLEPGLLGAAGAAP